MKYLNIALLTLVGLLLLSDIANADRAGDLQLDNKVSLTARTGKKLTLGTADSNIEFVVGGVREGYIDATGLNGFTSVSPTLSNPTISGITTFTTDQTKLIPGTTSLRIANNANSAINFTFKDTGDLVFGASAAKVIPGATSLSFRNNADSADNLSITDAGIATSRGGYRFSPSGTILAEIATTSSGGRLDVTDGTRSLRVTAGSGGAYVATTTAHDLSIATNNIIRWAFNASSGALTQDATNGGDIGLTKAGTSVYQSNVTGLTATGTTIADAYQLDRIFSEFSTVAAGSGAKLYALGTGSFYAIKNSGANALLLYPSTGSGTINRAAAGASVSIAAGATAYCFYNAGLSWMCGEMPAA